MKRYLVILCTLFFVKGVAQISPTEIGTMTDVVSEPSGLAFHYNTSNGHFEAWTHNDKGNQDSIYSFRIDDLNTIRRTIDINVDWIDWEDMTTDDAGNIYVGDFGNFNGPDELQVVKIPDPNTYSGSPPNVEIIEFEYPFAGISDAEAMFHLDNSLYIFSKSFNTATNPNLVEGMTYCFRIPDEPSSIVGGSHIAELVGSFQTQINAGEDVGMYRVAAADISPDKQKMILLCYGRAWVFSCFQGNDFFGGTASYFDMQYRQYEGVSFINNHEIFITKEGNINDPNYNPKMYHLDIFSWIDGSCYDCEKTVNGDFSKENNAWSLFRYNSADATLNTANGAAEIDIHTLGTSLWHINIRHKTLTLKTGKTYRVSYKAYADDDRPISVILNNASGSTQYAYFGQNITTVPTYYTHEFTMTEATNYNAYFSLNVGRYFAHKVYFDDISLTEVTCECPQNRYFITPVVDNNRHYSVENNIYVLGEVIGDNVTFDAGNCVELRAGFKVSSNVDLAILTDGCGN